jgi:hypothetical protein
MKKRIITPKKQVAAIECKRRSGFIPPNNNFISIKKKNYDVVSDIKLEGAAPKEGVKFYYYQKQIKKRFSKYIVKTGQKFYPTESITEQLFTDIGKIFRIKMANSELVIFETETPQIKFASKYFLKRTLKLIQGKTLLKLHLDGDEELADKIIQEEKDKELFNITDIYKSIKEQFPNECKIIFSSFIKLLLFDALVGNNDRHLYNWGIIKNEVKEPIRYSFSPVYDTARGLFWNTIDNDLKKFQVDKKLEKYITQSQPKISYDGNKKENHFELIEKICQNREKFGLEDRLFSSFLKTSHLKKTFQMIRKKYSFLFCSTRVELIEKCLKIRFQKLSEICLK